MSLGLAAEWSSKPGRKTASAHLLRELPAGSPVVLGGDPLEHATGRNPKIYPSRPAEGCHVLWAA